MAEAPLHMRTPPLVRLARFPFLPEVREAVRSVAPDVQAVLGSPLYGPVRARAMERVAGALGEGFSGAQPGDERSALLELLSIPVARMLLVELGDRTAVTRYAAAEAELASQALVADKDPDTLAQCLSALGIAAEPADNGAWRMHFSVYIQLAPLQEPRWKLMRRPMSAGNVWLLPQEAARLVEEALKRRIAAELEAERAKPLPPEVKAALAPMVAALQPKLEEAREAWSQGDFGPVQPGLFPPCIKEIFEALKRSENVPHHGRFAFATFLHTVGWNSEQILDYLAATPNFDREKSRYQIEHVTGGKSVQAYTPPGCATMQTNGVCPLAKRDGLCFKIKHPLNYYRAKLRFAAQDAARGGGSGPATPATPATDPQIAQIPQKPSEVR